MTQVVRIIRYTVSCCGWVWLAMHVVIMSGCVAASVGNVIVVVAARCARVMWGWRSVGRQLGEELLCRRIVVESGELCWASDVASDLFVSVEHSSRSNNRSVARAAWFQ